MSEYQYYEFMALDGPISDEGLRYAEGCSSRAEVSRVRWQNTYHFGDFRGSVDTMLKYYDAHFYIANWGTVRLGLAFPKGTLDLEAVRPYIQRGENDEETLTVQKIGDRSVLWWERNDEGGGEWTEGDGIIDQLIGIREEVMRGDYRALFLGWLADFYPEEWLDSDDSKALMPPIPPGLNQLSPALKAFIQHFPVDGDALAVATAWSPSVQVDRIPVSTVLEKLSVSEMHALLARVAEGGGASVMAELNRLTYPQVQIPAGQRVRCLDFADKAIEAQVAREKIEAEKAAAKQQRMAEQRRQHLISVRQSAGTLWTKLAPLMDEKIASAYDQAANHLQDLRDAYAQTDEDAVFQQKLVEFRRRYSNRPAMLRRIEKL